MSRITDRLLVQRTDTQIVFMDETTGAEVTFPVEATANVIAALQYLVNPEGAVMTIPVDKVAWLMRVANAEHDEIVDLANEGREKGFLPQDTTS